MLARSYVHTFEAGADAAPAARVVARFPADRQISDTFAARAFTKQLRIARLAAANAPHATAQLLSNWMSHNG